MDRAARKEDRQGLSGPGGFAINSKSFQRCRYERYVRVAEPTPTSTPRRAAPADVCLLKVREKLRSFSKTKLNRSGAPLINAGSCTEVSSESLRSRRRQAPNHFSSRRRRKILRGKLGEESLREFEEMRRHHQPDQPRSVGVSEFHACRPRPLIGGTDSVCPSERASNEYNSS